MTRRKFFGEAGSAILGWWLTGCSLYYGRRSPETERSMEDLGTLRHTYTDVNGLRMHSLVSSDHLPPSAPVVVLVHGSGLSGRYMIPTARQLTADCRVSVPHFPTSGYSAQPEAL